jgi:hypothetical protein
MTDPAPPLTRSRAFAIYCSAMRRLLLASRVVRVYT